MKENEIEKLRKKLYDLFTLKIDSFDIEINNKQLLFINKKKKTGDNKIKMLYRNFEKEYETIGSGYYINNYIPILFYTKKYYISEHDKQVIENIIRDQFIFQFHGNKKIDLEIEFINEPEGDEKLARLVAVYYMEDNRKSENDKNTQKFLNKYDDSDCYKIVCKDKDILLVYQYK
jgi:hypothetical protein